MFYSPQHCCEMLRGGVLRNGQGGVDIAMAVANCLAELDLRNAEATDKDDEVMIRSLVEQMPGGFDAVNAFMRTSIRDSLLTAHANFETDFGQLLRIVADIGRWQFLLTLCLSCFFNACRIQSSKEGLASPFQSDLVCLVILLISLANSGRILNSRLTEEEKEEPLPTLLSSRPSGSSGAGKPGKGEDTG